MKPIVSQRILVVEDDPRMLELLCKGLREIGHTAMPAPDGQVGLDLAMNHEFDAILLDLGLPLRDGLDVLRALRGHNRSTPILILTARDAEEDVLRGFESGADHYIVKPFSFRELIARLNGLARSLPHNRTNSQLVLNPIRLTVLRDGNVIHLTRSEYLLLAALHDDTGHTVSRQSLTKAIWGNKPIDPNTLDVLVNSLRGKFDASHAYKRIVTTRGVGYSLQPEASSRIVPTHQTEVIR